MRLLFPNILCAAAIFEVKLELASHIITELRQMASIQGDPMQRLAAYMVEVFLHK